MCILAFLLLVVPPALPQTKQPFPEAVVKLIIDAELSQYFDPASVFTISPSGASLSGNVLTIEDLRIEGHPAVIQGIPTKMQARFSTLRIEVIDLASQQVKIAKIGRATIAATSTNKDVQEGVANLSSSILNPKVKFHPNQFEITATIKEGERRYTTVATGNLLIENGRRLRAIINHAKVTGSDVPPGLIESVIGKVNPIVDLSKWPLDLQIERVALHEGMVRLLITGSR
jgi:hypothetical protein